MKRNKVNFRRRIAGSKCVTGELLISKLSRAMNSGEPIEGGAQLASTERKDGVLPQYNIKTDRFEIALETFDKIAATHTAQRSNYINPKDISNDSGDEGGDNNPGTTSNDSDTKVSS